MVARGVARRDAPSGAWCSARESSCSHRRQRPRSGTLAVPQARRGPASRHQAREHRDPTTSAASGQRADGGRTDGRAPPTCRPRDVACAIAAHELDGGAASRREQVVESRRQAGALVSMKPRVAERRWRRKKKAEVEQTAGRWQGRAQWLIAAPSAFASPAPLALTLQAERGSCVARGGPARRPGQAAAPATAELLRRRRWWYGGAGELGRRGDQRSGRRLRRWSLTICASGAFARRR